MRGGGSWWGETKQGNGQHNIYIERERGGEGGVRGVVKKKITMVIVYIIYIYIYRANAIKMS